MKTHFFSRIISLLPVDRWYDLTSLLIGLIFNLTLFAFMEDYINISIVIFLSTSIFVCYLIVMYIHASKSLLKVYSPYKGEWFQDYILLALPFTVLYLIFVVVPVFWSGLSCGDIGPCIVERKMLFHENLIFSGDFMYIFTLLTSFITLYCIWPFSIVIVIRIIFNMRIMSWISGVYWILCFVLMNISLYLTIPLSMQLFDWYG